MGLHVCNECKLKDDCKYAYKSDLDLWCNNPSPLIRKEQNERFTIDHENDFGYWVPQ